MKALKFLIPTAILILVLLGWALPIGPVPGFFIGGTVSDVPDSWGDTSSIHEIKLKVNSGGLPRVVIIWVVQVDESLFILGSRESGWVGMLGQGGPVQMRMGDNTYAMNASPVTTDWQTVFEAYKNKYRSDYPDIVGGLPASEEAMGGMGVFKLTK